VWRVGLSESEKRKEKKKVAGNKTGSKVKENIRSGGS